MAASLTAGGVRRERALEAQVDQAAVEGPAGAVGGGLESVKSVEQLMEGLELVTLELQQAGSGNPLLLGEP